MIRTSIAAIALTFVAIAGPCLAGQDDGAGVRPEGGVSAPQPDGNNRLMIVNRNSGRVIYDDGRNDLFCVTWRRVVGRDEDGDRIYRRTMRCR